MKPMRVALVSALVTLLALAACPPQTTQPVPPAPLPGPGWQPPPPPPAPPPDAAPPPVDEHVLGRVGDACTTGADCAEGLCEGQGCGDGAGVCATAARMCTQDLRDYCGCDGMTFHASGSCPGQRYSYAAACGHKPEGNACQADDECASGVCEGQGCGADAPGQCAPEHRSCTKDRRAYCGCDGQTFYSSGSCAGRRFAHKGGC